MNITLDELIELAKEIEYAQGFIDWGEIPVNEDIVYNTFATTVVSAYQKTSADTKDIVFLAAIIKLHVEAFAQSQIIKQQRNTISQLLTQLEQ